MTEVSFHLKKLKKLNEACGGSMKKSAEPEVDTSKMSLYEQGQYKVACDMKRTRENIIELDGLGEKASVTRKAELSNSIRKDLNGMKREVANLQKLAVKDKKKDEYEQLVTHVKKTENLYRARFGGRVEESTGPTGNTGATSLNSFEMSDFNAPMVSLREDEEFMQFFEQTKKNDELMDKALDRISAGVTRLHENALSIKTELQVQSTLLDETEAKVDKVHTNLKGVNKKLKATIKQVDQDRLCLYVFCFIILLGLGGGIYWVTTKNKSS